MPARAGIPRRLGCLAALLAVLVPPPGASSAAQARPGNRPARVSDALSRLDSQRLLQKVAAIEQQGVAPPGPGPRPLAPVPRTTLVTEREVNSYLAFDAGAQIPVGIAEPRISIIGDRRLAATALVDLDAVRTARKATGWFDPVAYLSGRLPVTMSGRLVSANGVGRFELESASISGVPIPKALIQEVVSYYSRTPSNPRGLNLDDPFVLPARIRQIDVRRGEALVIQ